MMRPAPCWIEAELANEITEPRPPPRTSIRPARVRRPECRRRVEDAVTGAGVGAMAEMVTKRQRGTDSFLREAPDGGCPLRSLTCRLVKTRFVRLAPSHVTLAAPSPSVPAHGRPLRRLRN
jgi:hypothetical protein